MKIDLKIYPSVFVTLAEFAHAVRHYIETTQDERGYIPRWKWTLDNFADRISLKTYQSWKKKKATKQYNFEIKVDEALAILEGLQAKTNISLAQQEILNILHQVLINYHFSAESLNNIYTQAYEILPN